jgi:hypothetical protein
MPSERLPAAMLCHSLQVKQGSASVMYLSLMQEHQLTLEPHPYHCPGRAQGLPMG